MKKLFLTIVVMLVIGMAKTQVMSAKMEWITIKSANLKCWECKERLMNYLKSENAANMQDRKSVV